MTAGAGELRVLPVPQPARSCDAIIDYRTVAPALRQSRIVQAFEGLGGGRSLEIVDDHDLAPVFDLFLAQYPGIFDWNYEERGPRLWRVRIDRVVP